MSLKNCFYISSIGTRESEIHKRTDQIFTYVIRPAAERLGYIASRVDPESQRNLLTAFAIQSVLDADIVVADLSDMNPSVMYELGIRHSAQKPVIHISTLGTRIPFDIAGFRRIEVDLSDIDSVSRAADQLSNLIDLIDSDPERFESPVSSAMAVRAFQNLSQKDVRIDSTERPGTLINILKDIESRLTALGEAFANSKKDSENREDYSRRIFIVHGHDGELKNELARLLERLGFEPIILHEQPDRGQTIFAKLHGEMADVGFAFIILTSDDVGATVSEADDLKPRARQNVIFEHGLFSGFLKPERVCAIRRGDVEIPSDLHGVLYKTLPIGNSIRSIALEIANELRAAGYAIDANKLLTI